MHVNYSQGTDIVRLGWIFLYTAQGCGVQLYVFIIDATMLSERFLIKQLSEL